MEARDCIRQPGRGDISNLQPVRSTVAPAYPAESAYAQEFFCRCFLLFLFLMFPITVEGQYRYGSYSDEELGGRTRATTKTLMHYHVMVRIYVGLVARLKSRDGCAP